MSMISVPPGGSSPWSSALDWSSSTSRLITEKLTLCPWAWKRGSPGAMRLPADSRR